MAKPVYLIDASIYIFKSYFAMPDAWINDEGYSLNAVVGYTQFLLRFLDRHEPDYIAAAFDGSLGQGFRHQLYEGYKASRALPDEALAFQLEACERVTALLGIATFKSSEYEADDLLATLARTMRRTRRDIWIVSRDKDLAQLLTREQDRLWEGDDSPALDQAAIQQKFGVAPSQLVDYLSLLGDSSDDIPGVPGVGKKTAATLLQRYGSLPAILDDLSVLACSDLRGARKLAERLDEYREQLHLAQQLVSLVDDIPLGTRAADLRWQAPQREVLTEYLETIGLRGRIHQTIAKANIFAEGRA
jgi:5'-3' exonuclease